MLKGMFSSVMTCFGIASLVNIIDIPNKLKLNNEYISLGLNIGLMYGLLKLADIDLQTNIQIIVRK